MKEASIKSGQTGRCASLPAFGEKSPSEFPVGLQALRRTTLCYESELLWSESEEGEDSFVSLLPAPDNAVEDLARLSVT